MRDTEDGQFGARIVLTAPGKASFTLIAMRHVAEQSFFNIVKKDLDSHDAVLCEGAPGRNLMTRLHRSICTKGLVAQGDGLPWDGQSHWYSADMDPKELRSRLLRALGWRWIPVLAVVLFLVIFGRALWLHKWIDQVPEDEDGSEEDHGDESTAERIEKLLGKDTRRVLLDDRDAILAGYCASMMEGWSEARIAVPWGAAHIPQLVRYLTEQHGYEVADKSWQRIRGWTVSRPRALETRRPSADRHGPASPG